MRFGAVAQLGERVLCPEFFEILSSMYWGRSSAGRASALQAGGRQFNSGRLHQAQSKY